MITSMFWTLAMNNQSNDKLKNYIQHDMERKNRRKSFFVFEKRLNTKTADEDSKANIHLIIFRWKTRNTQPNCQNSTILHYTNT